MKRITEKKKQTKTQWRIIVLEFSNMQHRLVYQKGARVGGVHNHHFELLIKMKIKFIYQQKCGISCNF